MRPEVWTKLSRQGQHVAHMWTCEQRGWRGWQPQESPGRDVTRVVTLFRSQFEQATLAAERGQDRATVFLGHGSTGATSRKAATLTKGDGNSFIFKITYIFYLKAFSEVKFTIKVHHFNHFKMYNSVVFNKFTM